MQIFDDSTHVCIDVLFLVAADIRLRAIPVKDLLVIHCGRWEILQVVQVFHPEDPEIDYMLGFSQKSSASGWSLLKDDLQHELTRMVDNWWLCRFDTAASFFPPAIVAMWLAILGIIFLSSKCCWATGQDVFFDFVS